MKEFTYADVEAATNAFSLDNLIGKGSHGHVYKATLDDGKLAVAVKKPSKDTENAILQSIHSPNVVTFIGATRQSPVLIMELMPNGSLHHLLHSSPHPPAWPRRATVALRIARAILALHASSPPVIHRDVKSANILFDRRWNAKLADFSLAVRCSSSSSPMPVPPAGTIGYLDPGYTVPDKLGPENDVYSFGVVLLELVSGRRAMDVECEPASVVSWAVPMIKAGRGREVWDRRVAVPAGMEGAVNRILGVAARCVECKEERRPGMGEVVGELTWVVEEMGWRSGMLRMVYRFVRGWRRRVAARVRTTKIVCRDHLEEEKEEVSLENVVVRSTMSTTYNAKVSREI